MSHEDFAERVRATLAARVSEDQSIKMRDVTIEGSHSNWGLTIYFEEPNDHPGCTFAYPWRNVPALIESASEPGQEAMAEEHLLDFVVLVIGENLMEQVNAIDMGLPPCTPGAVTWI